MKDTAVEVNLLGNFLQVLWEVLPNVAGSIWNKAFRISVLVCCSMNALSESSSVPAEAGMAPVKM